MSVIPADVDTTRQPPMTIPLRHFVVALGFLAAAVGLRVAFAVGVAPGAARLAHVHLLLAGWVCVTIMGAMTQFVPVWSGVELYSRRLATTQLWVVSVGLAGLAGCFLLGAFAWLPVFGAVALLGFWTFAYNVARTLSRLDGSDVTERHFGLALGFLAVVTALGVLLAVDFTRPLFAGIGVGHASVRAAHVTLAVFGVVVTTVVGALYQLATMFTQTKLRGVDVWLRRFEEVGYPVGVVALAGGRLVSDPTLARVGGALVALSLFGVAAILARRLVESAVDWTPMLTRYAVAAVALAGWAVLTLPAWLADPLAGTDCSARGNRVAVPARLRRLRRARDALPRRPLHRLDPPIQRPPRPRTRADARRPLRRPPRPPRFRSRRLGRRRRRRTRPRRSLDGRRDGGLDARARRCGGVRCEPPASYLAPQPAIAGRRRGRVGWRCGRRR